EDFLKKIPANRVKEVCIDMKTGYRKVVQRLFPDYVNKTMLGFPPYESFHTIFKIEPAKSFQKYPVILSLFKSRVFPLPFSRFSSFCHVPGCAFRVYVAGAGAGSAGTRTLVYLSATLMVEHSGLKRQL
ncbi:MAG: hypothetical protein PWR18_662, partial [Synergistales bacterium]|nr:hypothetical protein [Synergistales bacterium]